MRPEEYSGALVNRRFADTYFPGESPVGKHILQGTQNPAAPITGVVADAREEGLNTHPAPLVYFCAAAPRPMPFFVVRTQGRPLAIVDTVRRKVKELEPLRSVHDVMLLTERWSDTAAELRTWLLGLFSLVAIVLACVGLYGTMSYFANTRRREIGVRMALGAMLGRILRQFLRQGIGVAACVAAGSDASAARGMRQLVAPFFGNEKGPPLDASQDGSERRARWRFRKGLCLGCWTGRNRRAYTIACPRGCRSTL